MNEREMVKNTMFECIKLTKKDLRRIHTVGDFEELLESKYITFARNNKHEQYDLSEIFDELTTEKPTIHDWQ